LILPNCNSDAVIRKEASDSNKVRDNVVYLNGPIESLENKVINMLNAINRVTRKEVQDTLEMSQTSTGRLLKRMVDYKLIVQEGQGKNTYYRLAQRR
jgi:ATP-dependent DNA helicase RecG